MDHLMPYRVLLYYQYVAIADPAEFVREHLELCQRLGLRGRILVAEEGINGTVSGPADSTAEYMGAMHADPRFAGMEFKVDPCDGHVFRKLKVKVRSEIVTLGVSGDLNPRRRTGKRLGPAEFHESLQREDVVVLDVRNSYEYDLGHFRGAVRPDVKTFREFPDWVREHLGVRKDQPILTYCTGGIRCEKFTAFLLEEGFSDVSQLDGGIVTYGKDPAVQGHLFDGSCYVFDERAAVPINHTPEAMVVGRCLHCQAVSERLVNCANLDCDEQFICCVACEFEHRRSCSPGCTVAPRHEFDEATAGESWSFYR